MYLEPVCESAFSTVNFMKSKYRLNVFNENVASELRCARSVKYTPDFRLAMEKKKTTNENLSYQNIDHMLKL